MHAIIQYSTVQFSLSDKSHPGGWPKHVLTSLRGLLCLFGRSPQQVADHWPGVVLSCRHCKESLFRESHISFSTHVSDPYKIMHGDII